MEEENQVQQMTTRENQVKQENQVQQVTTKDPKKVEVGKRLTKYNRKKREKLKSQKLDSSQYYGIGAVLAVGVIGGLGYYIYQGQRGEPNVANNDVVPPQQPLRLISLKWSKSILYYKMEKKSIVNDLYHASLISIFAVGYSMLGKKILKMAPLSIQKFDLEDAGKLVVIIAASEMTREYLIKQWRV